MSATQPLPWETPSDRQRRTLGFALGVSLILHGIMLSIHFKLPEKLSKATEQALDVILVNSKSARKPEKAQAKAQANLDGGGNTDENRRAKTPLPVAPDTHQGDDLTTAQKRVAQLESQQRQMLTSLQGQKAVSVDAKSNDLPPTPNTPPTPNGLDLANTALNLARLEGQIARNIEEYNKRPRKKFIGARVEEYRFAQYVEDWRQKVERVGNLNYPEAAKGRHYGSLVLTVVIKSDGSLERVDINRPSGQPILDNAARRIVEMAAPYSPFPANVRQDTDILEITRTWSFTTSDRLQSE